MVNDLISYLEMIYLANLSIKYMKIAPACRRLTLLGIIHNMCRQTVCFNKFVSLRIIL